jgi:4-amino-4-deoxy-L-arabinose transferase-like glycosyltransferase
MCVRLGSVRMKKIKIELCYLCLILTIALASRVSLLVVSWRNPSSALAPDSASYLLTAGSLATEGSFRIDSFPELLRTPGYPAFLVACRSTALSGYSIAQVVQVLLDVLLVYLVYALGVRLVGRTAGLWAATFQACSLVAILSSVQIMSDGLFSFLVTVAILLLVRYFQGGDRRLAAAAAATAAAATYVRPVGFIFVPIVMLVLLIRRGELATLAAFLTTFVALVMPWYLRNFLVARYTGFSSVSDYNLLFYEAAGVSAKYQSLSTEQARAELEAAYGHRLLEEKIDPRSPQAIRVQREMGARVVLAHPGTLIRVHLATSLNSLLPAGTGLLEMLGLTSGNRGTLSVLHTQGFLAAVKYYFGSNTTAILFMTPELIYLIIRYLACSVCAWRRFAASQFNWGAIGWLITLTLTAFLLVAGPAATARFRLPVEPLLNLTAGAGVAMVADRGKLAEGHVTISPKDSD